MTGAGQEPGAPCSFSRRYTRPLSDTPGLCGQVSDTPGLCDQVKEEDAR